MCWNCCNLQYGGTDRLQEYKEGRHVWKKMAEEAEVNAGLELLDLTIGSTVTLVDIKNISNYGCCSNIQVQ